jgi:phage antirepressor YoqD-like protein
MEMLARAGEHFKARYEQEQKARIEAERSVAILESKIEADEHKTRMFDQCMESGSLMSISTMAKKLARPGLGPRKIFGFLRDRRILFRNHAGYWVPYQIYIERGFFAVKQEPRRQGSKTVIDEITRVTQRGYDFILGMVDETYPLEATA